MARTELRKKVVETLQVVIWKTLLIFLIFLKMLLLFQIFQIQKLKIPMKIWGKLHTLTTKLSSHNLSQEIHLILWMQNQKSQARQTNILELVAEATLMRKAQI